MKKFVCLLTVILICAVLFAGCGGNKKAEDVSVDYSQYPFVNTSWTRDAENDIETIRFGEDGAFVYYCSCGNPVNDSDLNEGYTYDDATKTITVKYIETTEETVSTIIIEECNIESIKLNFDGEIREFVKEKN